MSVSKYVEADFTQWALDQLQTTLFIPIGQLRPMYWKQALIEKHDDTARNIQANFERMYFCCSGAWIIKK